MSLPASPPSAAAAGRRAGRRTLAAFVSLGAIGALSLLAACGGDPAPVGSVALEPGTLVLPYPGGAEAELAWRPSTPLGAVEGELRVFVHLLDAEGGLVRTFDHPFPAGWEVGRPTSYPLEIYQSALGEPLPAGDYRLTVGLHDAGRRWPLTTNGVEVGRQEYQLGTVRVPGGETAGFPEVTFSSGWLAPEPGADRQILGRRWLGPEGAMRVSGSGNAARLHLVLRVPELEGDMERTLEEGEIGPALRITSSCDASETLITGTGSHRADLSVPAGADCEVRFDPNYRLTWPELSGPRSVLLENLYWSGLSPGAPAAPPAAAPAATPD